MITDKQNAVWGYNWDKDIQDACRREKKLLRASVAIPGGPIGNECNMKCIFCYTSCGTRFQNERCIDNQIAIEFLKSASKYAYTKNLMNYFLVSEGEPTLNPSIINLLHEISELGGTITIFSNLLELSPHIISAFVEIKNLFVCGKVYGFTPKINDELTGVPGSFDRMMGNIKTLIDKGLTVEQRLGVNCVLTKKNIEEGFDVFVWARNNNIIPHLYCNMIRTQGLEEDCDDLALPMNRLIRFYRKCSEYDREQYGNIWDPMLTLMRQYECSIHGMNIYLASNGEIRPCAHDQIVISNIFKNNNMKEIINNIDR